MSHLTETEMWDYISGNTLPEEQIRQDLHLGECARCKTVVRSGLAVALNWEATTNLWTAENHGRAYRIGVLASALRAAVAEDARLARRANAWLQSVRKGMGMAASALVDGTRRIGLAASGFVPDGFTAGLAAGVPGVASPQTAESWRHLKGGSDLLAEGNLEEAKKEVERSIELDARSGRATTVEIERGGSTIGRIVVDGQRMQASVLFWPAVAGFAPGFVALIPVDNPAGCRLASLQAVSGADYMLAVFPDLVDGAYRLEIETLASDSTEDLGD